MLEKMLVHFGPDAVLRYAAVGTTVGANSTVDTVIYGR